MLRPNPNRINLDPQHGPLNYVMFSLWLQVHRMQQMLEETLTKNMHLQQSLDHLSQVPPEACILVGIFHFGRNYLCQPIRNQVGVFTTEILSKEKGDQRPGGAYV